MMCVKCLARSPALSALHTSAIIVTTVIVTLVVPDCVPNARESASEAITM